MNTARVDYINIGLMLLSMIGALVFPFELFLFSFIILGPLHYITEIGWLHQRDFFADSKKDYQALIGIGALTCFLFMALALSDFEATAFFYDRFSESQMFFIRNWIAGLTFIGFITALALIVFKNPLHRLLGIALGIILAMVLQNVAWYIVVFGILIPTVIHTTIFTGAFILFGALKAKSIPGYLSFGVFIICSFIYFFLNLNPDAYHITQYVQQVFLNGEFFTINYNLFLLLHPGQGEQLSLNSTIGLQIQAFIAFAYTYHYLNWFSKTEVIKWHQIPRNWLIATIIIWIGGILLYLINIKLGLAALAFVSLMHVILEFPLNHRSFIGIGTELRKRLQFH